MSESVMVQLDVTGRTAYGVFMNALKHQPVVVR